MGDATQVGAQWITLPVQVDDHRFEEAERLLLDAHEALEKDPAEARGAEATARSLVLLYELWGRPEQAEAFRAESAGGGEH